MTKTAGLTPTAEGLLEKTPLVHLLVYTADRQLTGSLVLSSRSGGEDHAIYFFEGQASKVRTGEPIAHLGRVLFELGILSEETLNASLAAFSRGNDLHGEHLVRAGVIDRENLMEGLKVQADRKMAFLFALPPQTKYQFYQDINVLEDWGGPEIIPLDTLPIIWSAVRARADDPIVDATLRRLGTTTLKLHIKSDVARFGFSPHELTAIDMIRASPSSLAGLIETKVVPRRTAELIVYTLLITRHLDHRADSAPPVGLSKPASVNTPAAGAPSPQGGVPVARVKLTARQVPIEEAPPPSPRSPSPPAALSPELAARRDTILKRAEAIDREDYFSMLGIAQDGAQGEVQSAYFALAKLWHPDRLPPELGGVRDAASKVFARMSEAFETLSDAVRRKRYLDVMKGGGGTPEEADKIQQIIDAATDFQRAEILWKKRDPGAEEFVNRAYKSDPEQSDYIALYATVQLSKRAPDAPVDDLIKLCDHAIENGERCELAYFCRATLKKRIGRIEAAIVDFRNAYELNPKNLDAAREVRLYEMRRAKTSEQRRTTPSARRSTPPTGQRSSPPPRTSPPPKKPSGPPAKKEGGVLSGIGKLFKR
jgi:tetratricopeptide (TPR) repeat protein